MKTIGLRNNICTKNKKVTCGSKMLENFVSPYDSTIAEKLNKVGIKTENIDIKEFGIEEDHFVKEFFEKSNLNTAITVDGNGEIARNTTNGLVGLKTTFGLVSRFGVITTAPSLEQTGIISKNIDELREVLDVIKGYDKKDSGSVSEFPICSMVDMKIGCIVGSTKIFNNTNVEKITINNIENAKKVTYMISAAEASSNLARYDGIKYGYRTESAENWKEVYTKTRQEGFGYEAKKKMIAGTFFLDVDNMENYYKRAQKIRTLIKKELEKIFETVDAIAIPADSEYTCLANLTGRPAITANGVTVIGKFFEEDRLIELVKRGV